MPWLMYGVLFVLLSISLGCLSPWTFVSYNRLDNLPWTSFISTSPTKLRSRSVPYLQPCNRFSSRCLGPWMTHLWWSTLRFLFLRQQLMCCGEDFYLSVCNFYQCYCTVFISNVFSLWNIFLHWALFSLLRSLDPLSYNVLLPDLVSPTVLK